MPKVNNLVNSPADALSESRVDALRVDAPRKLEKDDLVPVMTGMNATPTPGGKDFSGLTFPSFLEKDINSPQLATNMGVDYVGFAHSLNKNWPAISAAGVKEGQMYIAKKGEIIGLDKLNYFILTGVSYLTHLDGPDMRCQYISDDVNEENPDPKNRQPHYIAVMIADVNERLIAVRGDFRGTKSNGVASAFRAVEAAATPAWLKLSDAHKATGAFPKPWGRVYTTMTVQMTITKGLGRKAFVANGTPVPTPISAMERLYAAFQNEDFKKDLNKVHEQYLTRVEFMNELVAKQRAATPAVK